MQKKTNGGAGNIPTGQTSRGYPRDSRKNPKNSQSNRPDVIGLAPDAGGAALRGTADYDRSDGYPETVNPSRFNKGTSATEPDPSNINRGYTQVTGSNAPSVRVNPGSNRQRFGIDPGAVDQPNGDTTDTPGLPRFGVGTNGE